MVRIIQYIVTIRSPSQPTHVSMIPRNCFSNIIATSVENSQETNKIADFSVLTCHRIAAVNQSSLFSDLSKAVFTAKEVPVYLTDSFHQLQIMRIIGSTLKPTKVCNVKIPPRHEREYNNYAKRNQVDYSLTNNDNNGCPLINSVVFLDRISRRWGGKTTFFPHQTYCTRLQSEKMRILAGTLEISVISMTSTCASCRRPVFRSTFLILEVQILIRSFGSPRESATFELHI